MIHSRFVNLYDITKIYPNPFPNNRKIYFGGTIREDHPSFQMLGKCMAIGFRKDHDDDFD